MQTNRIEFLGYHYHQFDLLIWAFGKKFSLKEAELEGMSFSCSFSYWFIKFRKAEIKDKEDIPLYRSSMCCWWTSAKFFELLLDLPDMKSIFVCVNCVGLRVQEKWISVLCVCILYDSSSCICSRILLRLRPGYIWSLSVYQLMCQRRQTGILCDFTVNCIVNMWDEGLMHPLHPVTRSKDDNDDAIVVDQIRFPPQSGPCRPVYLQALLVSIW